MTERKTEPNKEPEKEELEKPGQDGRDSLNEIERQLQECRKLREEYLAGWQRARADLLNYKKEEMERIGELLKYGNEEFILKILPILDNFEIIERKLPEDLKKDDNVKGILMLKNQLQDFLKSQGLEEIKTVGEKFDPNFHEAAEEITEDIPPEAKEPGVIVEEIQKGYTINNRLLRPAKVKIIK